MPYVESICVAGKTVEVERYFTARYGRRGQKPEQKVRPSKEEQLRINNRIAEKKLRRILNANFAPGDYHLILSYARAKGEPPRDPEDMKDDIAKFLRALRKEYKLAGGELKYIHVAETGSHGARHHHLVINSSSGVSIGTIQRVWSHGRIHVNPLDDSGNYKQLASYLIKYTCKTIGTPDAIQGKRWNSSKNLVHPVPEVRIITQREWFRSQGVRTPAKYARKGYMIDKGSIEIGLHSPEYGGFGFMRFTMVRD